MIKFCFDRDLVSSPSGVGALAKPLCPCLREKNRTGEAVLTGKLTAGPALAVEGQRLSEFADSQLFADA